MASSYTASNILATLAAASAATAAALKLCWNLREMRRGHTHAAGRRGR